MSDLRMHEPDDEAEYSGPLRRIKLIARVVFGAIALFVIAAFAIGLWHVFGDIWKEVSTSIATMDWSWWTWPRVLLVPLAPLGIAILVRNRLRQGGRRSNRMNSRANRENPDSNPDTT
jgi:hypothetical protein